MEARPSIGKAYRKIYSMIQKGTCLPPADMKDWALNRIPGVKRTDNGLKPTLGDHTDTHSNDGGPSEHVSRGSVCVWFERK